MYIKNLIIIYKYCPLLITQNKQTKMRIMRMLALLNVAKSEVYLQEYKLSLTRDLVLLKWIISTMLEKKMVDLCYKLMKEKCVERSWIHSAIVAMGLFRGQLHARPIIHQKKKRTTQWTKSAYEMKSSWVVQPKFRSFGGLCTAYRCGIPLVKNWHATSLQKWGWSSYYRMGVTFFFFLISIVTWVCRYDCHLQLWFLWLYTCMVIY